MAVIQSFADRETEKVFHGQTSRKLPPEMQRTAERKLRYLHSAAQLSDLRVPPANRLEKLSGNRQGQHSIRINQQWRICFIWQSGNAKNVEITDYH